LVVQQVDELILAIKEEEEYEDAEEKNEVRLVGRAVLCPKVVTKTFDLKANTEVE